MKKGRVGGDEGGREGGDDGGGIGRGAHLTSCVTKLEPSLFFSGASLYFRVRPSVGLFVRRPIHHAFFTIPYSSD